VFGDLIARLEHLRGIALGFRNLKHYILRSLIHTDSDTGEIVPITLVTDNGGPFRSFRFGAFIASPSGRSVVRNPRTEVADRTARSR